jgi:hypothetical protein
VLDAIRPILDAANVVVEKPQSVSVSPLRQRAELGRPARDALEDLGLRCFRFLALGLPATPQLLGLDRQQWEG